MKLYITLKPSAKQDEIVKLEGCRYKVSVKAPAKEGKANKALIKLLSRTFKVPGRDIEILRGIKSRQKTVGIKKRGA